MLRTLARRPERGSNKSAQGNAWEAYVDRTRRCHERAKQPFKCHATERARPMIHDLTIGHLDPDALSNRLAIPVKPLDEQIVIRVLAEFPGLSVEQRAGYLIAPRHGREDAERGEAFAIRLQAETGCLVADRRNGRIVELGRVNEMLRTPNARSVKSSSPV